MLITHDKRHRVQELQETLKNYGSEPIQVTAAPPTSTFCETGGNELSPEYEFSFSWSATITREHATGLMFPTTWVQRFTNLYADGIFVSAPVEQPSRAVSSNMTVTPQG